VKGVVLYAGSSFIRVNTVFVGDTKDRVYVNNPHSLQEKKDSIESETANISRQELYCALRNNSEGARPA
jgi:hypothetical protein